MFAGDQHLAAGLHGPEDVLHAWRTFSSSVPKPKLMPRISTRSYGSSVSNVAHVADFEGRGEFALLRVGVGVFDQRR